ncbi:nucleotidyltransferase domain-containing protein [Catenuloplanes atrovinosus]|uniref:Uncharacterized protein n=1 Tax=Catenuloplanes atrovinosus TaxID=137266 RepID=A0AAE3YMX9_9ACTN|nr:nucleotidyltransferase domain-containing protein [Catenuloplanes atrovinosus]MDR7275447.1 hypothetical protein [Catenuloplanes atrovinosus]
MIDPRDVAAAYLEIADRHAPGLVEGLYLVGSVALGDYHPGVSDIDFVAVTSSAPDVAAIRRIHAELHTRHAAPDFDGLYVSWDDLRADPATLPPGIAAHEWRVSAASDFERNLVTWHVLAQGGVPIRGPAADVFTDWPALAASTRRNLETYWTPWVTQLSRSPLGLSEWATTWTVLGVARLRHTLAAGRVTSKTAAAAYATATYDPRWHRVIEEALRIRVGGRPRYRSPLRRRADLLGFARDALRG